MKLTFNSLFVLAIRAAYTLTDAHAYAPFAITVPDTSNLGAVKSAIIMALQRKDITVHADSIYLSGQAVKGPHGPKTFTDYHIIKEFHTGAGLTLRYA
ncbi:hypothetical protein DFP72DRAFT_1068177 [Ephemerocybe angulata]|uniref:Uncharacterized protein n=1 Tax=Ephemerocybe angulata TaxID=980116 RepID=A0A8H6HXP4_9AGAR|nr:hypothetical protein DFP72DRAFT_1068177 [Tulosesus angulatus]